MLNKIIHFSLQNRILVLVASVLLLIGGTYTAMHTEVDVFPDLNAPTVVIMTEANGMAAEEVEQLVTFPVETAVNGATGVRRVRSSSTNGFSVVWVEFDWETDVYLARQIVSEKLAVVSESLPSNVGKPTLGPQSSILGEMLIVGLTADSTSMLDLRTIADWTIRPRLLSTGGVAQVAVLGGDIKEYQIQLDPERMRHYGVTLTEVMNVTREMNLKRIHRTRGNLHRPGRTTGKSRSQAAGRRCTDRNRQRPAFGRRFSRITGRHSGCTYRSQASETGYGFRTRQTRRTADRDQTTRHKHPGTDRQAGNIPERLAEEPAVRCEGQHRHFQTKPLYRKLHR